MFKEIKVKKAINGDEEAFVELIEEKKRIYTEQHMHMLKMSKKH